MADDNNLAPRHPWCFEKTPVALTPPGTVVAGDGRVEILEEDCAGELAPTIVLPEKNISYSPWSPWSRYQ